MVWESINRDAPIQRQLLSLAFGVLKQRQIGSQECASRLLGHHLFGLSRGDSPTFINVRPKDQRCVVMRPLKSLKAMSVDCTDVYFKNWVDDFYQNRPFTDEWDEVCLCDAITLWSHNWNEPENGRNVLGMVNFGRDTSAVIEDDEDREDDPEYSALDEIEEEPTVRKGWQLIYCKTCYSTMYCILRSWDLLS